MSRYTVQIPSHTLTPCASCRNQQQQRQQQWSRPTPTVMSRACVTVTVIRARIVVRCGRVLLPLWLAALAELCLVYGKKRSCL